LHDLAWEPCRTICPYCRDFRIHEEIQLFTRLCG
jgi:hypothetical protein